MRPSFNNYRQAHFLLSEDLLNKLSSIAKQEEVSRSALVRSVLRDFVKEAAV